MNVLTIPQLVVCSSHSLMVKKTFVFCGNFGFFQGIQITLFCCRSRIRRSTSCVNLPPAILRVIRILSCMQKIAGHSAIAPVKKGTSEISFKSSIRTKSPQSQRKKIMNETQLYQKLVQIIIPILYLPTKNKFKRSHCNLTWSVELLTLQISISMNFMFTDQILYSFQICYWYCNQSD